MPQVAVNRGQVKTADTLLMKSTCNRCLKRLGCCGLSLFIVFSTTQVQEESQINPAL